jgi:SAM-dependent methyltransferase
MRARCDICGADGEAALVPVRPNLRAIRDEQFHVWRCQACGSIHAQETVDLERYYRGYPRSDDSLDWLSRQFLRSHLRRLRRAGVTRAHSIIDFGCGSGKFVHYLRHKGFNPVGYDAYVERFKDPAPLERRYDVVYSQDVVEHAEDPAQILEQLDRLVVKGGLIVIGTPNASGIDLAKTEKYVHTLHAPFHRHIFSERALRDAGRRLGWELARFYPHTHNTPIPFLNYRSLLLFLASRDNTIEALGELRPSARQIFHPLFLFYGLFGALVPPKSECQLVFRARAA